MMHTNRKYTTKAVLVVILLMLAGGLVALGSVPEEPREFVQVQAAISEKAVDPAVETTTTTGAPVVVVSAPSTTQPKPRATKPRAPKAKVTNVQPVVTGDVWYRLSVCESGHTNANTGNGFYGYFQFVPSTWRGVGGTGMPHHHGYEEQKHRAQILQSRAGWKPWPGCSKKLGLR